MKCFANSCKKTEKVVDAEKNNNFVVEKKKKSIGKFSQRDGILPSFAKKTSGKCGSNDGIPVKCGGNGIYIHNKSVWDERKLAGDDRKSTNNDGKMSR
jgi:hypothetical protein